jgi:CRISPR-associated protein Cst2
MNNVVLVTGLILIDAPAAALNNAGIERGRIAENKVIVKKIRLRGREEYPYVSGQAFKRWWREALHENHDWKESPISREEKVAYTESNPIEYEEDDLFGYMLAPSKKEGKGLVYRRIAPLKCTPLISVFSNVITDDFGVFSRGPAEKEPVPFEQEFYSTILKGLSH